MSYHLRLKKALSYAGVVKATRDKPDVYVEDEATAAAAVDTGYFELLPGGSPDTAPPSKAEGTIEAVDTMNLTQLRAYAKKKGLDPDEVAPKGAEVEAARAAVLAALPGNQPEGVDQFAEQGGEE